MPCILDNETPAQWEGQAFNFCKALLHFFSVKGGTPILIIRASPIGAQYGIPDSKSNV